MDRIGYIATLHGSDKITIAKSNPIYCLFMKKDKIHLGTVLSETEMKSESTNGIGGDYISDMLLSATSGTTKCANGLPPFNCGGSGASLPAKEQACCGKCANDPCEFTTTSSLGYPILSRGRCVSNYAKRGLHCSDTK